MDITQPQNKYPTIEEALLRAERQKSLYENNLVGKRFVYAYINKDNFITFKEVQFERKHYLHLTGLDYKKIQQQKRNGNTEVKTEALQFYLRLGQDDTLLGDVSFIQGATPEETQMYFRYTQRKLENLSQLTAIAAKAEFIGKYNGRQDFDVIINRNMSAIAFVQDQDNNVHIPVSSLYGKAADVATNISPVLAIFCKENEQNSYKLSYLNSKINIGKKLFSYEFTDVLTSKAFENSDVKFNQAALDILKHAFDVSLNKRIHCLVNDLSAKRSATLENEDTLAEYENALEKLMDKLDTEYKGNLAIDFIRNSEPSEGNILISRELMRIKEKFTEKATVLSEENIVVTAAKSDAETDKKDKVRNLKEYSIQAAAVQRPQPVKQRSLRELSMGYNKESQPISESLISQNKLR